MNSDDDFTRETAIRLILGEAFAENGFGMMLATGQGEPGVKRVARVIAALEYLGEEMADEDTLPRELVSALFFLAMEAGNELGEQGGELIIAASMLVENWNGWPDPPALELAPEEDDASAVETLAGYHAGDITYCQLPEGGECFPVEVALLQRDHLVIEPIREAPPAFYLANELNRKFYLPQLSPASRFGGEDERLVNAARKEGPELRLLPCHYATTAGEMIRARHQENPEQWPLPTGEVYARWFKDR